MNDPRVIPLHRGIRVIGSVDQALIDGAHPLIPPETLDAIYRRHDGLDAASEQRIADLRDRMNRRAAVLREQRRIGIACIALSVFMVVYMAAQFLRLAAF